MLCIFQKLPLPMINCGNCTHIRIQAQRVGDTERESETHPAIDTYIYIYIYRYTERDKQTQAKRALPI